jgi:multiple sugar transport system permease protein
MKNETTSAILPRSRTAKRRLYRNGLSWRNILKHILLILAAGGMIYPVLWMVASSLRPSNEIFRHTGLLVEELHWQNYVDGWTCIGLPFGHFIVNSTIVAVGCIVGNLMSCSLAAYAFARIQFRLKNLWFAIMLLSIMLPIQIIIIPQYVIFSAFGWTNTFIPLILPKMLATAAFFLVLMLQFIRGIPRELDEAARIDGCGHLRVYWNVILPLTVPALATTTIFTFIWTWNDFFSQLVYLTKVSLYTVPVALRAFMDASSVTAWGPLLAMSVISLIPLFLVFLFTQRYLIEGIATTGGK